MRRIVPTPSLRDDDGATAVIVAILALALFGLAAFALDIGHLMWERSRLQNSADAGALAAAQDLAAGGGEDAGKVTADDYVLRNNPRGAHLDDYEVDNEEQSVTVTAGTGDSSGEEDELTTWFASVIGIESTRAAARATAQWSAAGIDNPQATPLTASMCDFFGDDYSEETEVTIEAIDEIVEDLPSLDEVVENYDGEGDAIDENGETVAELRQIDLQGPEDPEDVDSCTVSPGFTADGDEDGESEPLAGGFGYLRTEDDECTPESEPAGKFGESGELFWSRAKPGNSLGDDAHCLEDAFEKEPAPAIPIYVGIDYDDNDRDYLLYAPASFYIVGINVPSVPPMGDTDCEGGPGQSKSCVKGFFVEQTVPPIVGGNGAQDLGTRSVELID